MNVQKINYTETYSVRHSVLRKGKPIETTKFEGDELATTIHFGLFEVDKIIGVISVLEQKNYKFSQKKQFQIRGMAILEEYQNKNLGALLIEEAEKYCKNENAHIIWFNAREKAVNFYKKFQYEIDGISFEIPQIGTHYVMYKILN